MKYFIRFICIKSCLFILPQNGLAQFDPFVIFSLIEIPYDLPPSSSYLFLKTEVICTRVHLDYSILANQLIISIHRCSIVNSGGDHDVITDKDLEYLLHLLDGKDAVWQSMIERSTTNMACQAWRYEPEVNFDVDFH